jgi:hypothetical protein
MKRDTLVWLVVFAAGVLLLGGRALLTGGFGKVYVDANERTFANTGTADAPSWKELADGEAPPPGAETTSWTEYATSSKTRFAAQPAGGAIGVSNSRTIGVWIAAFLTLFVMSFLVKDNPFYKIAESIFIGVSAAYWMVVGFWGTIVPNLFGKLSPDLVRAWWVPGLGENERVEVIYLVPLILGVMLLWRLAPKGGWISRWPMAFFIGTFCGLRLISFLHADFLSQIRNGIVPLFVQEAGSSGADVLWDSLRNVILVVGVLACLVYFFFSIEHRGVVGHTARLGVWFLMITFGAAFGYTVMGRIALLAIRIEFLLDDWLWLIDPTGNRVDAVAAIVTSLPGGFVP